MKLKQKLIQFRISSCGLQCLAKSCSDRGKKLQNVDLVPAFLLIPSLHVRLSWRDWNVEALPPRFTFPLRFGGRGGVAGGGWGWWTLEISVKTLSPLLV